MVPTYFWWSPQTLAWLEKSDCELKAPPQFYELNVVVLLICLWYVSRGIHEVLNMYSYRFRCPFKNCYATSCCRWETSWNVYNIYIYQLNAFTHTYTYIYIHIFICSLPETLKLPSYYHPLHVLVNMHLMLSQPREAPFVLWYPGDFHLLWLLGFSTEKDPKVVVVVASSGRSLLYASIEKNTWVFPKIVGFPPKSSIKK